GEFPVLLRRIEARQETSLLLLLGEVQEKLPDHYAVARHITLERPDVLEPLLPQIFCNQAGWNLFGLEEFRVDAHDQNLLVVGTIENSDVSALGHAFHGAPH